MSAGDRERGGAPGEDRAAEGKAGAPQASKGDATRATPDDRMPSLARRTPDRPRPAQETPAARTRRAAGTPDRALQDVWVTRLRQGCPETLREVVLAFSERLTAVVRGILRDRDAVEDVVQETFVKAFYRIHGFKGTSSLYTWLYRIAVNATKDYIKSRKRRPAASLEDLRTPAALMPAQGAPMIEGLEQRELRLRVHAAIARLPVKFRTVLALREIEGMPYHEIAAVLDLSLGTVESRLFRARRRLRTLLHRELPGVAERPETNRARRARRRDPS